MALYERALTHRSRFRGRPDSHRVTNERLEFLGDALLGFIVGEALYRRFPDQDEGYLTRLRAKLVSRDALARYARRLGLGPHLLMSENAERSRGRSNPNILSDAYEALIGALYLDQGLEAARTFVHRTALDPTDLDALAAEHRNYKSLLQEHLQAHGRDQPSYRTIHEEGPSHDKTFTVEVLLDGTPHGAGTAGSKQKAEQKAARKALDRLLTDDSG
jgi:ribonuclease-3